MMKLMDTTFRIRAQVLGMPRSAILINRNAVPLTQYVAQP